MVKCVSTALTRGEIPTYRNHATPLMWLNNDGMIKLGDVHRSDETPNRTGPRRTALDFKILGDGIDQTPLRTGDPDTLSQRGYGPTTQF